MRMHRIRLTPLKNHTIEIFCIWIDLTQLWACRLTDEFWNKVSQLSKQCRVVYVNMILMHVHLPGKPSSAKRNKTRADQNWENLFFSVQNKFYLVSSECNSNVRQRVDWETLPKCLNLLQFRGDSLLWRMFFRSLCDTMYVAEYIEISLNSILLLASWAYLSISLIWIAVYWLPDYLFINVSIFYSSTLLSLFLYGIAVLLGGIMLKKYICARWGCFSLCKIVKQFFESEKSRLCMNRKNIAIPLKKFERSSATIF